MALWPFGKKNKKTVSTDSEPKAPAEPGGAALRADGDSTADVEDAQVASAAGTSEIADSAQPTSQNNSAATAEDSSTLDSSASVTVDHDAINGETGPFDGDNVDIADFDFSDFSTVALDLGSMKVALPKESQVQVEMGENGPKMVHIATRHGRATPVAFAAPRTGGTWEESSDEIAAGMRSEGMPVVFENGPWGREIVGTGVNGVIRIIGVEGPRWLYRVTLASPNGKEEDMASLGREIVAHSFIYRGSDPVLAGNSLPVVLPAQLAQQVRQAVQTRAAQDDPAQANEAQTGHDAEDRQAPPAGNSTALSDAMNRILEINENTQNNQDGRKN